MDTFLKAVCLFDRAGLPMVALDHIFLGHLHRPTPMFPHHLLAEFIVAFLRRAILGKPPDTRKFIWKCIRLYMVRHQHSFSFV